MDFFKGIKNLTEIIYPQAKLDGRIENAMGEVLSNLTKQLVNKSKELGQKTKKISHTEMARSVDMILAKKILKLAKSEGARSVFLFQSGVLPVTIKKITIKESDTAQDVEDQDREGGEGKREKLSTNDYFPGLKRIAGKIFPVAQLDGDTKKAIGGILFNITRHLLEKSKENSKGSKKISENDMKSAVETALTGEILRHAKAEGSKSVLKFNSGILPIKISEKEPLITDRKSEEKTRMKEKHKSVKRPKRKTKKSSRTKEQGKQKKMSLVKTKRDPKKRIQGKTKEKLIQSQVRKRKQTESSTGIDSRKAKKLKPSHASTVQSRDKTKKAYKITDKQKATTDRKIKRPKGGKELRFATKTKKRRIEPKEGKKLKNIQKQKKTIATKKKTPVGKRKKQLKINSKINQMKKIQKQKEKSKKARDNAKREKKGSDHVNTGLNNVSKEIFPQAQTDGKMKKNTQVILQNLTNYLINKSQEIGQANKTISPTDVMKAIESVLPREISNHAKSEGAKCVLKFECGLLPVNLSKNEKRKEELYKEQ